MYGWIWHRLPFGWPGKLASSVLLIAAAAALLWYVAFPAVDPYLPYNDGQVTNGHSTTNRDDVAPVTPSPPR
ncbi:hypothetical protein GCM10023322_00170 [Rugosimonospora acidiphila]|uniref:Uncharacterized protein n=1 Tax=Rugosimonospora acidiphila TaxID=556531 RepID=A0ABP9RH33_9ACTN